MSLRYKFDELKESNLANKDQQEKPESSQDIERFDTPDHSRSLCLIELSGKQTFLNYSYLISGEYSPDENTITLFFTTHTVILGGQNIEIIFSEILTHSIKSIVCADKRYVDLSEKTKNQITDIKIKTI